MKQDKLLDHAKSISKKNDYGFVSVVPLEIDTHFELFGKHMWEVEYYEICVRCNKKIDEFGYCACNGIAE